MTIKKTKKEVARNANAMHRWPMPVDGKCSMAFWTFSAMCLGAVGWLLISTVGVKVLIFLLMPHTFVTVMVVIPRLSLTAENPFTKNGSRISEPNGCWWRKNDGEVITPRHRRCRKEQPTAKQC